MPAYFWCAHCSHESTDEHYCSFCGLEKKEKLFPLWQRATDRDPDSKKKYEERALKTKKKPWNENFDW